MNFRPIPQPGRPRDDSGEGAGVFDASDVLDALVEKIRARHDAVALQIANPAADRELLLLELEELRLMSERVVAMASEALEADGMLCQVGVFIKPARAMKGVERAAIRVAGREYEAPLVGTVRGPSLVSGMRILVNKSGDRVVAYEPGAPEGGAIRRVAGASSRAGWVELESDTGGQTEEARISGFIDQSVEEGARVRVLDGFVIEVRTTRVVEQAGFRDSCLWDPAPWTLDDIVGQADAVRRMGMLADRRGNPDAYGGDATQEALGNLIRMLVGPPGNGKTIMAAATYHALRAALGPDRVRGYLIRGSQVKDKWVGNTGKNIRAVFDLCVRDFEREGIVSYICLDEFDDFGRDRAGGPAGDPTATTGPTQLLTYFDGSVRLGPGVIIVCLSNHLPAMDEALLRAGRAGGQRLIHVPRLDAEAALAIVRKRLAALPDTMIDRAHEPAAYARAFVEALAFDGYGTAVVHGERIPIPGSALTSGAMAADAVMAGIDLVHEHIFACRRADKEISQRRLTPAALHHGTRRSLLGVLEVYSGAPNLARGQAFFAGGLAPRDEPGALTEVQGTPASELPAPPARYALQGWDAEEAI